jgi:hypothetical protein
MVLNMKTKIKTYVGTALVACSLSFNSCTDLSEKIYDTMSPDIYQFTPEDAQALFVPVYNSLRDVLWGWYSYSDISGLSGDLWCIPNRIGIGWGDLYIPLHKHEFNPQIWHFGAFWTRAYAGVTACNRLLADPAVHVFDGKLYIYPSHDWESGIAENDNGDHFNMKDYHVYSMDDVMNGEIKDHGVVLSTEDIPWAGRQLWDCDVVCKDGKYYMYFPLKDQNDIFRIGVAVSDKPYGPFIPEANPMKGSYSIDPAVWDDGDGNYYMYFGGLWGGQLQRYRNNKALESAILPEGEEEAIPSRVARLSEDMMEFAEEPRAVVILDEDGKPLTAGDTERRFFEASWMHKYNGKYYFSYSTGDTHLLCYATGDNPYGPFTYQGVILTPVVGWTTHHAIVEFKGKWYLFHHDCVPSEGKTWLRSLKVCELQYDADGRIITIEGKDE